MACSNLAVTRRSSVLVAQVRFDMFKRNRWLSSLVEQIGEYDEYTLEHCRRVCDYSIAIGIQAGCDYDELLRLGIAGILHDYGKIFIPISIINKPDKLTEDEFNEVKLHVELGCKALQACGVQEEIIRYILEHHERDNGKGYPNNLGFGEISLGGRILAIADVFDAVTVKRVYQENVLDAGSAFNLLLNSPGMDLTVIYDLSNTVRTRKRLPSGRKLVR